MVQRKGGFRRKTRNKMKKSLRSKGKISLRRFFHEYDVGDRVLLSAEPAYQRGMYLPRFHGKSGIVQRRVGMCYDVLIKDQSAKKVLIIHPIHLRLQKV